ncbi:MAG: CCA tRNA nucleotidyltransferase [Synergistaceae bacterium]|nr:CCA tRNA nucleotidyltransferase [Synergistaceae bacterium]MBR1419397.1 CCA tRNA nucleotidyltransferase [Synergistaceae bacterium]
MRDYMNILKAVEDSGVKAWLVGDTVRMIEMGMQPNVITMALDTDDLFRAAAALGAGTVDARGPFPALRGEINGTPFRGFSLQGGSIENDLARRDFSIEAIAIRSDGGIVDPFGGIFDIRNKVLRLTGDDIELIYKDPLRIVRMLRLAAELEMDIFWKTDADIRKFLETHADVMNDMPLERWGREIINGMKRRPWRFIRFCDSYNLLPFFLKDLDNLKNVNDNSNKVNEYGKPYTIFDHVLGTLHVIEDRLDTHKIMQRDAFILAGLFSRINTRTLDEVNDPEKRKVTDRLITEYLTNWNIPSDVINEVISIIGSYNLFYKPISEEQLCKYIIEYDAVAVEVAREFAACIAIAEKRPEETLEILRDNRWNLSQVLRRFDKVTEQMSGAERYLTGREIMNILHIAPSKRVGELLDALDFAVGTGKVCSRKAAEQWLLSNA